LSVLLSHPPIESLSTSAGTDSMCVLHQTTSPFSICRMLLKDHEMSAFGRESSGEALKVNSRVRRIMNEEY
jgi:hypothetical protein